MTKVFDWISSPVLQTFWAIIETLSVTTSGRALHARMSLLFVRDSDNSNQVVAPFCDFVVVFLAPLGKLEKQSCCCNKHGCYSTVTWHDF